MVVCYFHVPYQDLLFKRTRASGYYSGLARVVPLTRPLLPLFMIIMFRIGQSQIGKRLVVLWHKENSCKQSGGIELADTLVER